MTEEIVAGFSKGWPPYASLEERDAKCALQFGDLSANGRLSRFERPRCAAE